MHHHAMNHTTIAALRKEWKQRIGEQIRLLRLQRRWSLRRLSARCGVSAHKLDLYECGRGDLQLNDLFAITCALQVTPEQLMTP
jgi:transcriptional regulator with XRE-family HTH domain